MNETKKYTPVRQVYAWIGLHTILALAIALIWGLYALVSMQKVIVITNEAKAPQRAVLSLQHAGTREVTA